MTGREPLRVGLVGCGNVALNDHVPAYLRRPGRFRVVAVADPTGERRELARAALGLAAADAHGSAADLLARGDLEVVDVCTPQALRREIVLGALAGGRHVLCEKPLAARPAEAAELVDTAAAAGVRLALMHNYLFLAEIAALREAVARGAVGEVEVAVVNYLGVVDLPGNPAYAPRWRHDAAAAGGGVLVDMLHGVYVA